MIKKILVAVGDGPERDAPVRYANNLARSLDAELYAFHVVKKGIGMPMRSVEWNLEKEIEEERKEVSKVLEKHAKDKTKKINFKQVQADTPAQAILDEARTGDYDLIVLGDRDRPRLQKMIIGSTSNRVAHHSLRPILVVKNYVVPKHLLVCVDGSVTASKGALFAAKIAKKLGAKITLLQVIEEKADMKIISRIRKREREIIKNTGMECEYKIRKGDPAEQIILEARECGYHLIVIGSRGTAPYKEFMLGDVVGKVLRESVCPTLIYRTKSLVKK